MNRGYTLLELITALTLAGTALALGLSGVGRVNDRFRLLGAREELFSLLTLTKAEAVAYGAAELSIETEGGVATVTSDAGSGVPAASSHLKDRYGVEIRDGGGRASIVLRFGPLGLGAVASRTILLSRGQEEVALVVSSYGRVSRR